MTPHYLLDTRTVYQRVRDWIFSLFRSKHKTTELEVTRFLSSYERKNRALLSNSLPIEKARGLPEESERTSRKIRVYPAPPDSVAGRNSYLRCRYDSDDKKHSNPCSPVRPSPPRPLERVNSQDCINTRLSAREYPPLLKHSSPTSFPSCVQRRSIWRPGEVY